jgi:SAM-dependent methyltransferase
MDCSEPVAYSEIVGWRPECHRRFGGILDLKVAASSYAVARELYSGGRILDVGAGREKSLQKFLDLTEQYYSLDSDPQGSFSFADFSHIPAGMKFQMVVMNQVLEHLNIEEAKALLTPALDVLVPQGRLLISVPNAAHPVRYHADVWHRTNWPFNDLYGLVRHLGFDVEFLFRSNKRPFPRNPFKRWMIQVVSKEFRVDWCDTIILCGKKP